MKICHQQAIPNDRWTNSELASSEYFALRQRQMTSSLPGGSRPEAGENRYVTWLGEWILFGSDLPEVIFQAMFYIEPKLLSCTGRQYQAPKNS